MQKLQRDPVTGLGVPTAPTREQLQGRLDELIAKLKAFGCGVISCFWDYAADAEFNTSFSASGPDWRGDALLTETMRALHVDGVRRWSHDAWGIGSALNDEINSFLEDFLETQCKLCNVLLGVLRPFDDSHEGASATNRIRVFGDIRDTAEVPRLHRVLDCSRELMVAWSNLRHEAKLAWVTEDIGDNDGMDPKSEEVFRSN